MVKVLRQHFTCSRYERQLETNDDKVINVCSQLFNLLSQLFYFLSLSILSCLRFTLNDV